MAETKEKDLCVVCQCHKCGHLLYLDGVDDHKEMIKKIKNIEKTSCPNCGEEGYENWILRGIDDWNKRKIHY